MNKMVLDFHSHTFPEAVAKKAMDKLTKEANIPYFTDATNSGIRKSMEEAGVDVSLILPVVTAPAQTEKINRVAIELNSSEMAKKPERMLLSFGGIHPENENFKEVLSYIKGEGLKGIKLHPVYQGMKFDDIRYKRIVSYCMEQDLVVITHAGFDLSYPGNDLATTKYIAGLLKDTKPEKLVLAHMGGYGCWDEIEEVIAEYGCYVDTGFTVQRTRRFSGPYNKEADASYNPAEDHSWWPKQGVITDEQFCRIVKAAGPKKVLFGSDSPWNDQKEAVENITRLIADKEQQADILGRNACELLGI